MLTLKLVILMGKTYIITYVAALHMDMSEVSLVSKLSFKKVRSWDSSMGRATDLRTEGLRSDPGQEQWD